MPDRMPEDMPDRMPEDMPDKLPEDMPEDMPEGMPDRMSDRMPVGMPDKVPECLPDRMPEDLPDRMPDRMSEDMPEDMPDSVPEDVPEQIAEDMPDRMPEDMPDRMPEDMPDKMPEGMSDRMPEDLPVTKCINVMVGITRSKVIFPNVGNTIINHPPVITIFIGGMFTIPKWVVYDIVLTTSLKTCAILKGMICGILAWHVCAIWENTNPIYSEFRPTLKGSVWTGWSYNFHIIFHMFSPFKKWWNSFLFRFLDHLEVSQVTLQPNSTLLMPCGSGTHGPWKRAPKRSVTWDLIC